LPRAASDDEYFRHVISARGLARAFRRKKQEVRAVDGVDIDVAAGEIVGFLGPNGAGKTTTLRMLTTLLEPSAGTATVAGCDLLTDPVGVRRRIGYVSQSGSTQPEALAGEEVVDHARLYGLSTAEATARGERLFSELELEGLWTRKPKAMSGGQRRRLDIVMGLVHEPGLLFLDEPTTGLDPQARANLWQHIRGLREERGTTVFLTTHYLDEADALCDRLVIVDHGLIVAQGTPGELKREVSGDVVTLRLTESERAAEALKPFAREVRVDEDALRVYVDDGEHMLPALLRTLEEQGIGLSSIALDRSTLDDVFLAKTGRSLRDVGAAT
jgi:ABC-2 type transport system ATP-binding protein